MRDGVELLADLYEPVGPSAGTILERSPYGWPMVMAASSALADFTEEKYLAQGLIYPPMAELQETSIRVATRVIAQAFSDGVARTSKLSPTTAEAYVRSHFWRPRYLPFERG